MGMTKKIEIDGKEVLFKASAAIPRIYRIKFQRDIYKDLSALEKAIGKNVEDASTLDTFSIYQVLPQLIELCGLNVQTDVSAKKTSSNRSPDDNTLVFASLCTAGISIRDLDLLTIGLVNDMYAENCNDDYKGYKDVATQEGFDKF